MVVLEGDLGFVDEAVLVELVSEQLSDPFLSLQVPTDDDGTHILLAAQPLVAMLVVEVLFGRVQLPVALLNDGRICDLLPCLAIDVIVVLHVWLASVPAPKRMCHVVMQDALECVATGALCHAIAALDAQAELTPERLFISKRNFSFAVLIVVFPGSLIHCQLVAPGKLAISVLLVFAPEALVDGAVLVIHSSFTLLLAVLEGTHVNVTVASDQGPVVMETTINEFALVLVVWR